MTTIEEYLFRKGLKTENSLTGERADFHYLNMITLMSAKKRLSFDNYFERMKSEFYKLSGWFKVTNWEEVHRKAIPNKEVFNKFSEIVVFVPSSNENKEGRWFEIDGEAFGMSINCLSEKEWEMLATEEEKIKLIFSCGKTRQEMKKNIAIRYVSDSLKNIELEKEVETELITVLEEYLELKSDEIIKKNKKMGRI